MSSHQEVSVSVRVNVTPAIYACQLSYDSSVMVLRKVVILWFAIAFLCRLRSIATHRDHFVRRLSVRPSVCLSVCHIRRAVFRRRHMHSSECCHYFSWIDATVKAKLSLEDGGVYCFWTCRSADRHVGRDVGKSVSPKTAIYNWRTRLKPIGFKLRTLITIRRWSLSHGRLLGHVKTILDFVVNGRGVSVKKN